MVGGVAPGEEGTEGVLLFWDGCPPKSEPPPFARNRTFISIHMSSHLSLYRTVSITFPKAVPKPEHIAMYCQCNVIKPLIS